jgi:hypothetical protein
VAKQKQERKEEKLKREQAVIVEHEVQDIDSLLEYIVLLFEEKQYE